MSWIEKLYQTYNNCVGIMDSIRDDEPKLLPICHTTQNAHIRVYLDGDGHYDRAEIIQKDKSNTVTPCTEESGSRAGIKPVNHPLFDKLQYVAGDFIKYGGEVTSGYKKNPKEPHIKYINDLSKWCSSSNKHTLKSNPYITI
jgi:CRISPR-associated protein Csd1